MTRSAISLVPPGTTRRALRESFTKLHPRHQLRNPVMFVVLVGSVFTLVLAGAAFRGIGDESPWFILGVSAWLWLTVLFANFAEALAEGRGKAQADALRRTRTALQAKRLADPGNHLDFEIDAGHRAPERPRGLRAGGRVHPGGRGNRRGRGLGGRERRDGRERPRHPRERRRPERRDRRHPCAVRLAGRPGDGQPWRVVPRPHDRPHRGGAPKEDAQRDRAGDPAGRPHADFPPHRGHAPAVLHLQRGRGGRGHPHLAHRAGGPPRVPHPDDDRRAALGHRHRRHGPDDPEERDRDVGPRSGGGRRRGRAAPRQDRHHHAGEPAGGGLHAGGGRFGAGTGRRRPARLAGRRDARRAEHRGACQGEVWHPGARRARPRRALRGVFRGDPDERRGSGRPPDPQGRRRDDGELGPPGGRSGAGQRATRR